MSSDAAFLEPLDQFLNQNNSVPSSAIGELSAYGLAPARSLQTSEPLLPDLGAIAFDSAIDHVLSGRTVATFTLKNLGGQDAAAFDVNVVLSDDEILGNADDQIVSTVSLSGLAAGDVLTQTVDLQLPVDSLNANALSEDPAGQAAGYVSASKDFLGLVIDPQNVILESNEANNLNGGKGKDKDDITYFPWDLDGSGSVTPTDAIFVVNRLGQTADSTNDKADLDGNGSIAPTDAIAIINRLGYAINPAVTMPTINASLANDTGLSKTDRITVDPTISGVVADATHITTLRAGFGNIPASAASTLNFRVDLLWEYCCIKLSDIAYPNS